MAAAFGVLAEASSLSQTGSTGCANATHCSCNENQAKHAEFEKTDEYFSCQLYLRSCH